jgi:putative transcriptional regulator
MKNRIKVERAEMNLTQEALAEKVGVTRQTINTIEKGNDSPSILLVLKLASVFGKPVDEVFELEKSDWDCD